MESRKMNVEGSELIIKNLHIRNKYKDMVLESRNQELRKAHGMLCELKRQCRHLTETLEMKEKEYSNMMVETGKDDWLKQHNSATAINQSEKLETFSGVKQAHNEDSSKSNDCFSQTAPRCRLLSFENGVPNARSSFEDITVDQRTEIELDMMAFEKEELQVQLECVTSEKERALEECACLRSELETAKKEIAVACNEASGKSTDLKRLTESLAQAEEELSVLFQMVDGLKKEIQTKEAARKDGELKIEELEELLMVLQSDASIAGRDPDAEKAPEASRILDATVNDVPASGEVCENDVSLRAAVQEKENIISRLMLENDELDCCLVSQRNLVAELRRKIQDLEETQQNSTKKSCEAAWEKERKELNEQIEILGGLLAQLQSECNSSQQSDGLQQSQQMSQLLTLRVEASTLQVEKEDLQEKLLKRNEELENLRKNCGTLDIQLKRAQEEISRRNRENMKVQQQLLSEKSQLLHSLKNLQAEQNLWQKGDEKFKLLEIQNSELLAQLLILKDKNAEHFDQVRDVSLRLEAANGEIETLKKVITDSACYVKDLKARNQQLQLRSLQITEALGRAEEEFRRERAQDVERISSLYADLQEGYDARKALEDALTSEKMTLNSLKSELEKAVATSERYEKELNETRKELNEKQKLNHLLGCEVKKLASNMENLQHADSVKTHLPRDDETPDPKRLKIARSSERKPLSTTQLLQTPTSTQKSSILSSFLPRPDRLVEDHDRTTCLIVPESPPSDQVRRFCKGQRIEDREKSHTFDSTTKENQQCTKNLQTCQVAEEMLSRVTASEPKTVLSSHSLTSWTPGCVVKKTPNARRVLCLNRRNNLE